jgi:hypothetical protein
VTHVLAPVLLSLPARGFDGTPSQG